MENRELARNEWVSFMDQFSREHENQRVTLEIQERSGGPHTVADHVPFQGIAVEHRDRENALSIILASPDSDIVSHNVSDPVRIRTISGAQGGLEIESGDGTKTRLRFDPTAPAA